MAALAATIAAILAWLIARRRWTQRLPARSLIISPRKSTVIAGDGAVRSVQSARLTLSRADLDRLWTPGNLENLGRTYWRFLSRVTLRLIRVVYGENERSVVLIRRPLTLLRFDAPEYLLESERGRVTWRIKDGLLVARSGRGSGWLCVDVRRTPGEDDDPATPVELTIEVEVANFYPSIASGLSTLVYEATQAFVHVLVTHAFLRSLATLELAESKVRYFSEEPVEAVELEPVEVEAVEAVEAEPVEVQAVEVQAVEVQAVKPVEVDGDRPATRPDDRANADERLRSVHSDQ